MTNKEKILLEAIVTSSVGLLENSAKILGTTPPPKETKFYSHPETNTEAALRAILENHMDILTLLQAFQQKSGRSAQSDIDRYRLQTTQFMPEEGIEFKK